MATGVAPEVDLTGIDDPQRFVAFGVGLVLVAVGVAGLTGIVDADVGLGSGLVAGLFAVPFWLGVTAIVAGLLGVVLSFYAGAGTTFDKLAAGLVLPIVLLLSVADWGVAAGGIFLVLAALAFLLAGAGVAVGVILLYGRPLALVLPVVAVLTLADWVVGLTAMAPASEPVNVATVGLLAVLAVVLGVVAFEGGSRTT